MDVLYGMPNQPERLFLNVVHACPNACLFCVDFKGDRFYGFDLKHGHAPTEDEIVEAVAAFPHRTALLEVYYCGIGEPLLRYTTVIESARRLRPLLRPDAIIAVNTSGTFYLRHRRVDFVRVVDLVQVSLNAENEEKYDLICRPKVRGAFRATMDFLDDLRAYLDNTGVACRVELSVVDTSEADYLPVLERKRDVPRPDIAACQRIADGFGWPLKVKKLIADCENPTWSKFADSWRQPNNAETHNSMPLPVVT